MINSQQMLEDRKNIYLIGMMGSGKSTVGKMVASKTNMHFLDSDKIIEENAGNRSEIFLIMVKTNSGDWKEIS